MRSFSLLRVFAVLSKEFTQLRRDRITFAMILMMPIMQLLIFGYAINNDPHHLPAAVFSADQGPLARSVVVAMQHTRYLDVVAEPHSAREMDALMRQGKILAAVTIPPDFSRRVIRRDGAQILVEIDASDPTAVGGVLAAVTALPDNALVNDLKGAAAPPKDAGPAFEVVAHRLYNPENITAYNIVPGLLGVILSMTLVMMTSMAMTREYERGTMESLLATPVTAAEVMVGKLAPYVLVGLIQTVVVLTLSRGLFHIPMADSLAGWLSLATGVLLFIIGSLSLGYLFSTVARSQLQAMQISLFYLLPSIFLSGFAFPFLGLPHWARVIGEVIPVTHFLRIVRGSLLKHQILADMTVDLAALSAFVVVVAGIAIARSRTTLD